MPLPWTRSVRRSAIGIESRRAETRLRGSVHESPARRDRPSILATPPENPHAQPKTERSGSVPDSRKHRGPGPQDPEWFSSEARPDLAQATADLSWLLSRGYAEPSSLKLVGDRYRLVERQRVA